MVVEVQRRLARAGTIMVPLTGSWGLKRDEQFALTNATTYARVRRYRTAVHRADAITFINFPAALLLSAWIPRRSHFDDLRAHAADIRAISRQRNHPVATDILLRKCRDSLARLISKCAFNTGRAQPLQHDGRKRNLNEIAETIRLRTGDLAGLGVAFGSGMAIKKLEKRIRQLYGDDPEAGASGTDASRRIF